MSVSIRWAPASKGHACKHGTSSDVEALKGVFDDDPPWTFGPEDERVLRAMGAAAGTEERDTSNVYRELADLVAVHEWIRVWTEY